MPCERAVWMIRSASRSEPHFASFRFTPSTTPTSFATSVATRQLSSATIGRSQRSRTNRSPSMSVGGSGCSINSTPSSLSSGAMASVCFGVHAAFASTRSVAFGASIRTNSMMRRSRSLPSLTLRIGKPEATASRTRVRNVSSSAAMAIVKLLRGDADGVRPHNFQSGSPSRLPCRSCSAALTAQRAAALKRSALTIATSSCSISHPFDASMIGRRRSSAASTVSAVSP